MRYYSGSSIDSLTYPLNLIKCVFTQHFHTALKILEYGSLPLTLAHASINGDIDKVQGVWVRHRFSRFDAPAKCNSGSARTHCLRMSADPRVRLPYKARRQYLVTFRLRMYCLLVLPRSVPLICHKPG